jgi:hypothetical protein
MSELQSPDPYHGLASIDPTEWQNIPRPLVSSLKVFKEVSIDHTNKLQDLNASLYNQRFAIDEELGNVNKEMTIIKAAIAKNQQDIILKLEETYLNLISEISKFKTNLNIDLDYKQKNNDSKVSYLEEQIFHIKHFTNALPNRMEIDNKIADSCAELRTKVKNEIKDTMIMPEIRGLAYDIRETNS